MTTYLVEVRRYKHYCVPFVKITHARHEAGYGAIFFSTAAHALAALSISF